MEEGPEGGADPSIAPAQEFLDGGPIRGCRRGPGGPGTRGTMFNDSKAKGVRAHGFQEVRTVLGEGTRWQGDLHVGAEGLRVEGEVEGTLLSEGDVVVAAGGWVRGTLQVRNLRVSGRVEGVVRVMGCLEIQRTGWVEGEMELGSLVVDEGGTLQGTCMPRSAVTAAEAPEPELHPRRDDRFSERPFPAPAEPAIPARGPDKPRF